MMDTRKLICLVFSALCGTLAFTVSYKFLGIALPATGELLKDLVRRYYGEVN